MSSTECSNHLASPGCPNAAGKASPLLRQGARHGCSLPTLPHPYPGASSWWIQLTSCTCQTCTEHEPAPLHWCSDLEVRENQPLKSHSQCVWFGRSADGASLIHILPDFEGIAINFSTWIKFCYSKPTGLVQSVGRRGGKGRLRLQMIAFSRWWRLFVFLMAINHII